MFELELEEKELISLPGKLSPAEVVKYAQSRGWKPVVGVKGEISVFNHPDYGFRQLIVPKRKTDDYSEAIFEVLRRLEACEGRAIRCIARDMRNRRKIGFSCKARVLPLKQWRDWQWRPEFSGKFGYLAWLFVWLNFSWEYGD